MKKVTLTVHQAVGANYGEFYGAVRDATTGELLINAKLDYCLAAIKERGWLAVRAK